MKRVIGGVSYAYIWRGDVRGWDVISWDSTKLRWKSYRVALGQDNLAITCSCPSHMQGRRYCKHMQEADAIYYERKPQPKRRAKSMTRPNR